MTGPHRCRACLAPDPYGFLPMGDHPPANMFVPHADLHLKQPVFSLDTEVCLECGLIQVEDQIPADFFRHYLYVPSGAATMHGHFAGLAERLAGIAGTGEGAGLIVDIGCNDGLMLMAANALGCRTLGVDPAANLAEIAATRGVNVHVGYFDSASARELKAQYGAAKVIVTTNTFNHIGDLHAFMAGIDTLLAPDGTFVIEVPWAKDLLAKNEFDTVYQEHLSEFSLRSIALLARFVGMELVDVERLGVHGGSMRVFLQRSSVGAVATKMVGEMLEEELSEGMLDAKTYDDFALRIGDVRLELMAILDDLKRQGLKIAGYGAPAKGNTLLNYFNIGTGHLDFLVDRNPLKQGLYSPGMKVPVRHTDAIRSERPDVLLVLAWNFFDEIREQQHAFEAGGGRFLVPLPRPVLVG
ncbi:class I SAM-dependent methyltransferase [Sandarakinorhabdus glacialis]|nr:class I SAM-dependent methyltransferase [Polymorphobacter glacialis]